MAETVTLRARATPVAPAPMPALFATATRSAGGLPADDAFLPAGYIQVKTAFELAPTARAAAAVPDRDDAVAGDDVLVLELGDGGTLVTSAARLQAALARNHPELLGTDGGILLDRLNQDEQLSRGLLDGAFGGLVRKMFALSLAQAPDGILQDAAAQLAKWQGLAAPGDALQRQAELGVSWLGTKAVMWAIEKRLNRPAGQLYRWDGRVGETALAPLDAVGTSALSKAAREQQPMLVFIHGTGSSTQASFRDLQASDSRLWNQLEKAYPGGIYAFEHRTLSESPIENARQLAEALPTGARVSLVTHSRGGLVGDLLCLRDLGAQIQDYRYRFSPDEGVGLIEPLPGQSDADERQRVAAEMERGHAEQRAELARLAQLLANRGLVVQRYVRVAAPARGTRLASANFDVFLSGLLSLVGAIPGLFGNPLYSALKRVVLEITRNRTNPHLVPGIEAQLPDSPLAALLRDARVQPGVRMAVVAGDIEGRGMLQRLGVLLTDFLLFDHVDHDLVVDTAAMLGGIASQAKARVLFDQGSDVSHFRYFANFDTRDALRRWLVDATPESDAAFQPLPAPSETLAPGGGAARRGAGSAELPVVVLLPGIMGTHLNIGDDHVWLDPLDIAAGGLAKIAWERGGVQAGGLFAMSYGAVCEHLAASHRVEPFPYDWRQPLDVLGERLGAFLDALLCETSQPVRLLAHSMGGLLVRAAIHRRREVMDRLMARSGSRLVMLGTPHQGAHSMVENLLGKGDTLRTLVRLDMAHDMQQVLDLVAGFRGALQLLPKPGFNDTFQGDPGGGERHAYDLAATWAALQQRNTDLWFGDQRGALPVQPALDAASWLWRQDGQGVPGLPADYAGQSVHVFGFARNTPCGLRYDADVKPPRLRMVGTTQGDGTVTWASSRIANIGSYYYMTDVVHGDLLSSRRHFEAIGDLLQRGATVALATTPPAVRDLQSQRPVAYDPAPPDAVDTAALSRRLLGGSGTPPLAVQARQRLEVRVRAMDLRFVNTPIMVGHYAQDTIAGPQQLIDTEMLNGELSQRRRMGLYAGPLGTASAVLRGDGRGGLRGAVVAGLGPYDGSLGPEGLTLAVCSGVMRYLLHAVETGLGQRLELPLACVLLGHNSAQGITIAASLEALVRGTIEANARFREITQSNVRVARLEIVELYQDTAISAVYEMRLAADTLTQYANVQGIQLLCVSELLEGEGMRPRLRAQGASNYWPRLMVTDAERPEGGSGPAAALPAAPLAPCRDGAARSGTAEAPRLAEVLRFVHIGQRARAETVLRQRQPALIEALVRQQIGSSVWSDDFGRMLFQLLVPHDFKQAARDLRQVVLVVDAATGDIPWELMLATTSMPGEQNADGQPLSVRIPMVRQLSAAAYRQQVRHAPMRSALVVGNPSVTGFAAHFPDPVGNPRGDEPKPLPAAQDEAVAVAGLLSSANYQVVKAIGAHHEASAVLALLYRQPYRVLHVSAHGVFSQCHLDGRRRSGVLLSGGVLLTAAEIESMEFVPELVFLNCCHLGQLAATVQDGNKLAASVARELIAIGVRCVLVAGWAVNDRLAQQFAEVFYRTLYTEGRSFGQAVFAARRAVWQANPRDITWGAFQAYGDPAWQAEPRQDLAAAPPPPGAPDGFASPDELLDELARLRSEASRKLGRLGPRERRARVDAVQALLDKRCPASWRDLPVVLSALGATWRDLGETQRAQEVLRQAIQAEDAMGRVPIRDIEQLANIEARHGEHEARQQIAEAVAAGTPVPLEPGGLASIRLALKRLVRLGGLVGSGSRHAERSALRGSAWQRMAAVRADQLRHMKTQDARRGTVRTRMDEALARAIAAYASAEGSADAEFHPYNALHRLLLQAVSGSFGNDASARQMAVQCARDCGTAAQRSLDAEGSLWDAVLQPAAVLAELMCSGELGEDDDAGRTAHARVLAAYTEVADRLLLKPGQLDTVATNLQRLADFCDALGDGKDAQRRRMSERLRDLARQLQPEP